MANLTQKGTLFPEKLVSEMFNNVKGHSALALLSGEAPIPFNGNEIMTFSMGGEAEIVGEGSQKSPGDATVGTVAITPVKFVYQHRVSDEFVRASEEDQVPYLKAFADGFAKKMARALDIAAFHGVNPATSTIASTVSGKSFDALVTQETLYTPAKADENIDDAVATILAADGTVSGIAMTPAFGAALAKIKANGAIQYPEFRFGASPKTFFNMGVDVNSTVGFGESKDVAIVGDFANAFRWGYAANVPLEVIAYGDPDGQGDLKRKNQVVLRAEAYIGWGILDASAFNRIVTELTDGD